VRLFGRRLGSRTEICCVDEKPVGLGVERRVARTKFGFDGFDDAEFLGRVFAENVQCSFARRSEQQVRFRLKNIGVHACADRKRFDHFSSIGIHNGKEFVTTPNKEPVVLDVHLAGNSVSSSMPLENEFDRKLDLPLRDGRADQSTGNTVRRSGPVEDIGIAITRSRRREVRVIKDVKHLNPELYVEVL